MWILNLSRALAASMSLKEGEAAADKIRVL